MSRKKDFDSQLLKYKPVPQKKLIRRRRTKSIYKHVSKKIIGKRAEFIQSVPVVVEPSSIYTFNDDVEEDLCVVELPASTIDDTVCASELDYIVQMPTAADQLKSQTASINATIAAVTTKMNSKKKRGIRRSSGTSSEEERWLDAIESGKLEQVDDELKKIKDPKLMTARQRAMYKRNIEMKKPSLGGGGVGSGSGDNILKALPIASKGKVMTAEAIEKAQLKSLKRKQLADEKREKNKRDTMDRLLKKQEAKLTKVIKSSKTVKCDAPVISYYDSTANGSHISFPKDFEIPIKAAQLLREPPPIQLCGICNEEKKRYNCTKTNTPLCSFECYKLNLERRQQINQ